MVSYRQDPYLWVHLAGLAALPLLLDICLLGLAVGTPRLPVWSEMGLLILIGVVPVIWMQWQRPFYIFSLLLLAIRPAQLSEERRRMLPYFRSFPVRVLTAIAPVLLIWVLWQLYCLAPIAASITPFAKYGRGVGLLVAAIAFLACNLFLQVPLSVLRVLLVGEQQLAQTEPITPEEIPNRFTSFGLQINQILPEISEASPQPSSAPPDASSRVTVEQSTVEESVPESVTTPSAQPTDLDSAPDAVADIEPDTAQSGISEIEQSLNGTETVERAVESGTLESTGDPDDAETELENQASTLALSEVHETVGQQTDDADALDLEASDADEVLADQENDPLQSALDQAADVSEKATKSLPDLVDQSADSELLTASNDTDGEVSPPETSTIDDDALDEV
ncbi:MAG: low-complexity tail membrane protein [Cyanobacteria bacterium P01_A01_bin.123]